MDTQHIGSLQVPGDVVQGGDVLTFTAKRRDVPDALSEACGCNLGGGILAEVMAVSTRHSHTLPVHALQTRDIRVAQWQ